MALVATAVGVVRNIGGGGDGIVDEGVEEGLLL